MRQNVPGYYNAPHGKPFYWPGGSLANWPTWRSSLSQRTPWSSKRRGCRGATEQSACGSVGRTKTPWAWGWTSFACLSRTFAIGFTILECFFERIAVLLRRHPVRINFKSSILLVRETWVFSLYHATAPQSLGPYAKNRESRRIPWIARRTLGVIGVGRLILDWFILLSVLIINQHQRAC